MKGTHTMSHQVYLQPIPVRIWHWLNAFSFVVLIATGAQIRFPEHVSIFDSIRSAVLLHNAAGIVVALSFCLWFCYYALISKKLVKLYVPTGDDIINGLFRQARFYFLLYFLGRKNPHHASPDDKFNPLQKSAYLVIMFALVPVVIVTGLALMYIQPLHQGLVMIGGLKILIGLHYLVACCLFAFMFVHIYLATLGKTPLAYFIPMFTGWEEVDDDHGH
jgi:thiosulfate reductase cytochrome b subunit